MVTRPELILAAPMVDPRSVMAYRLIGAGFVLSFVTVLAFGFRLSHEAMAAFWSWPFVAFAGMLARRVNMPRIASSLEGIALLYGQGFCLLLVLYSAAAISGPYADDMLARWDAAIGFYWPSYAQATLPYEGTLTFAYRSFAWQPLLLVIALVWAGQTRRMWALIVAAILASAATIIVFPFFPAEGVHQHFSYVPSDFEARQTYRFTVAMEYFRGGGTMIEPSVMTGLVSFPSYHSTQAVLFGWAAWSLRALRWPMIILNAAVLLSVPVIGAHYLVDVFAGSAVAVAAIYLARRLDVKRASKQE